VYVYVVLQESLIQGFRASTMPMNSAGEVHLRRGIFWVNVEWKAFPCAAEAGTGKVREERQQFDDAYFAAKAGISLSRFCLLIFSTRVVLLIFKSFAAFVLTQPLFSKASIISRFS